eukprot:TRINITY_DN6987_c0_g1_i1.p1 TRINITY_DN6987_c0_g1~~TRINITY_DN6987_c0_g1_i1.p1  ORF type:complete len:410 (+),score=117.05 TRINITY_DN6987_c0_g1_i1:106-1335(+)
MSEQHHQHRPNSFLAATKAKLLEALQKKDESKVVIYVVLGNEAADLDSMASAITLSLLRSHRSRPSNQTGDEKDVLYVPVVNIPAQDFVLRGECVYLFGQLGIDVANVVFWDQIDFSALRDEGRLRLVLVDHNHLSAAQEKFGDVVVEIVDHHVDEKLYLESTGDRRKIELIGSCSSLVAEEILESEEHLRKGLLTNEVTKLLAATILVDTVNFNPTAKKGTPKDRTLLDTLLNNYLKESVEANNPDEFFEVLQKHKFSVEHLTPAELIRRDYKEVDVQTPNHGKHKVGISSLPLSTVAWFSKEGANRPADVAAFARDRNLSSLMLMGAFSNPEQNISFARDLVVFGGINSKALFDDITKSLKTNKELKLNITNTNANDDGFYIEYQQGNAAASRKQLLPIVHEFLTKW